MRLMREGLILRCHTTSKVYIFFSNVEAEFLPVTKESPWSQKCVSFILTSYTTSVDSTIYHRASKVEKKQLQFMNYMYRNTIVTFILLMAIFQVACLFVILQFLLRVVWAKLCMPIPPSYFYQQNTRCTTGG